MNELLKKNCLTGDVSYSLNELIESCKKPKIKAIAARYGIKLSDKMTKPQMLADAIPAISLNFGIKIKQYSPETLKMLLDCLQATETGLDEDAAKKIMTSEPYEDGIVYMFIHKDKYIPCVPYEMSGKLTEYCAGHIFCTADDELTRSAKAAALIYGKFTPAMLANLCNNAYKTEYTAENAAEFLTSANLNEFTYSNGEAVCSLADMPEINKLADSLDYDLPSRKEVDAYAVYGFDSTNYYYRQIISFVHSKCGITYPKAGVLMKKIALWCMIDGALPDIFRYIQEADPKLTADQFNFLLDMIGELSSKTRKWALKGHKHCDVKGTVAVRMPQVQEKAPETVHVEPVRVAPKVGRNDPCPCGSGKKYKKCCGKNK